MTYTFRLRLFLSILFLFLLKANFAQNTITIGTGTTTVGYPFYSYYHDSRTQMLYTAAEFNTAGSSAGLISAVAFDVTSVASQTLNCQQHWLIFPRHQFL